MIRRLIEKATNEDERNGSIAISTFPWFCLDCSFYSYLSRLTHMHCGTKTLSLYIFGELDQKSTESKDV